MQNALSWLVVIGKPWETVFNHYFKRWESIVFFDGSCWKDVGFLMPSGQRLMVWSEPQVFSWFPWITFFVPWNVGHVLSWIITYPIFNVSLPKLGQESSTGTSACSRPYRMPSTSRYLVWRWANGSWGGPWNWMVWDIRHNPRMYVQNMHNMYILSFEYVAIQCYI